MITKEQFEAYERIRSSGITNMFMISTVCACSGLTREQVTEIMNTYDKLMEMYPGVRK